jgi:hypothetical protein
MDGSDERRLLEHCREVDAGMVKDRDIRLKGGGGVLRRRVSLPAMMRVFEECGVDGGADGVAARRKFIEENERIYLGVPEGTGLGTRRNRFGRIGYKAAWDRMGRKRVLVDSGAEGRRGSYGP